MLCLRNSDSCCIDVIGKWNFKNTIVGWKRAKISVECDDHRGIERSVITELEGTSEYIVVHRRGDQGSMSQ